MKVDMYIYMHSTSAECIYVFLMGMSVCICCTAHMFMSKCAFISKCIPVCFLMCVSEFVRVCVCMCVSEHEQAEISH